MTEQYPPQPYQPYPPQISYLDGQYPQPGPTPPAVAPHRGLAITSLVLGLVGAAMGIVPLLFWMALVLGLLGLIFGCVGRRHGMGKAGIVLSLGSIVLGIVGAAIVANAVHQLDNDMSGLAVPPVTATSADTLSGTDEVFVTVIHEQDIWDGVPDTVLIEDAHLACNALDAGNSYVDVLSVTMDSGGLDAYDAGYFVGAAIGSYCPVDGYLVP